MSTYTASLKVRRDTARILLGDARIVDDAASFIVSSRMNLDEAVNYLRGLGTAYREAAKTASSSPLIEDAA